MEKEKILYKTKCHWVCYLLPLVLFIFEPILLVFAHTGEESSEMLVLFPILFGIFVFLEFYSTEFLVTNKRIISKSGIIRKNLTEIFLDKIESVKVDQGLVGRILGYGTIIISGTGGTKEEYKWVSQPMMFRKKILEAIDKKK